MSLADALIALRCRGALEGFIFCRLTFDMRGNQGATLGVPLDGIRRDFPGRQRVRAPRLTSGCQSETGKGNAMAEIHERDSAGSCGLAKNVIQCTLLMGRVGAW